MSYQRALLLFMSQQRGPPLTLFDGCFHLQQPFTQFRIPLKSFLYASNRSAHITLGCDPKCLGNLTQHIVLQFPDRGNRKVALVAASWTGVQPLNNSHRKELWWILRTTRGRSIFCLQAKFNVYFFAYRQIYMLTY